MKRRLIRTIIYALLLGSVTFLLAIFLPRKYSVPSLEARADTHFWQLQSGSRIAFVHIPAKATKKPFPIIYLHGGPGGHVRDEVISYLAPLADEGFEIYFYNQIGSGKSDRLEDITEYTVDRHVRDLAAITEKLGSRKVILIGQSWGAILATLFATAYPDRIERMVLTCPGPIFPVHQELRKVTAPDSLHLRMPIFTNAQGVEKASNIRSKAIDFFASRFGWKLASDNEADAFATYSGYQIDRSTVCDTSRIPGMEAGNGFYAGARTFKSLMEVKDYRAALGTIKSPVLILKGQCDNQPWGYTKEYMDLFQNHRFAIIPSAGHFLWIEQPQLSREVIRQFLVDSAK